MATTKPATPTTCLCGCGAVVTRRFAIGHDSKLKSRLVTQAIEGTPRERTKAEKQLADFGWTQYLDRAKASRGAKAEAKARREEAKAAASAASPSPIEGEQAASEEVSAPSS